MQGVPKNCRPWPWGNSIVFLLDSYIFWLCSQKRDLIDFPLEIGYPNYPNVHSSKWHIYFIISVISWTNCAKTRIGYFTTQQNQIFYSILFYSIPSLCQFWHIPTVQIRVFTPYPIRQHKKLSPIHEVRKKLIRKKRA